MNPKYQIRINYPSGEKKTHVLPHRVGQLELSNREGADFFLRDGTLGDQVFLLSKRQVGLPQSGTPASTSSYWISCGTHPAVLARLGDLWVSEAEWPLGMKVTLGETELTLEQEGQDLALPQVPSHVRPWLTRCESGRQLLWNAKKAAETQLAVYVGGETGTGKEVIANLIHAWSRRAGAPFVALNCGAITASLAESELFGHVKGSFTGAHKDRPGALLQAHSGTLFLDEVGDLSPDLQVKLLRFLENGEIRPVGSDRSTRADVRLICATHKPLEKLVEQGKFRQDLYYRIASIAIEIPALKDRPEDIVFLAKSFAQEHNRTLSDSALLRLRAYEWPGNVRELRHAIERSSGLASPFENHLGVENFSFLKEAHCSESNSGLGVGGTFPTLHELERDLLLRALKVSNGNRAMAAELMGVARSTLFEMLRRHKVSGPRKTANECLNQVRKERQWRESFARAGLDIPGERATTTE